MDMPSPFSSTTANAPATVTVRRGDTLVGLVKAHYKNQGVNVDERQAFRMALKVARGNGIADAARIMPGQTVRMDSLPAAAELGEGDALTANAASQPAATAAAGATAPRLAAPTTSQVLASRQAADPVFERTLSRAVERGFIPAADVDQVREKVGRMAREYGFDPDDFARVVLIESDGMNPSATNGRCHGIIQFCGGPGRGAASVGFANNAQDIGKMSVVQQLDLVDRYFQDVGMPRSGTRVMSLDDLYLSVLTPAARSMRAADAPLPIPGTQARVLYEGGQQGASITRRSITQGLLRYAQDRLPAAASQITSQVSQQISAVTERALGGSTVAGAAANKQGAGGSNWPSQRQIVAANTLETP